VDNNVGVCGDDLLLRGKLDILELEVTNGTGEREVSVDTSKVDESAGGSDTSLLACLIVSCSSELPGGGY
jgi:hypothetical protein